MLRRQQVSRTLTLKSARLLQKLEMEVKFAAAANFADFYMHRDAFMNHISRLSDEVDQDSAAFWIYFIRKPGIMKMMTDMKYAMT